MQVHPVLHIPVDNDLALRTLQESDATELFTLSNANRSYLRKWLAWLDTTRTVEDTLSYISTRNIMRISNGSIDCVLLYQGRVAGTIGFNTVDWTNRYVEIGYWLAEAYQGHGLMTKSCKTLVTYAFGEWHLNKVAIKCATQNTSSCAIPQRLGFTLEGTLRQAQWLYDHFVDLNVFGMLASEWHHHR